MKVAIAKRFLTYTDLYSMTLTSACANFEQ